MRVSPQRPSKSLSASMQKRVGHALSREDADLIFQPRKTLEVKPVANMLPRGTIVTVFTDGESVSSSDGNFYTKAEGQFEWLGCLEVDHRTLLSDACVAFPNSAGENAWFAAINENISISLRVAR